MRMKNMNEPRKKVLRNVGGAPSGKESIGDEAFAKGRKQIDTKYSGGSKYF